MKQQCTHKIITHASTQAYLNLVTMQIQIFDKYSLIKSDIPEIINKKTIVKDVNVGGIKLSYKVSTIKALVFNLFNKQRIIPISLNPYNTHIVHLLRPYKEKWDVGRGKLPKCLWGKKTDPLTNLWIELELDYIDLDSGEVILKDEIRNTNITKHLSKNKQLFYVVKK